MKKLIYLTLLLNLSCVYFLSEIYLKLYWEIKTMAPSSPL